MTISMTLIGKTLATKLGHTKDINNETNCLNIWHMTLIVRLAHKLTQPITIHSSYYNINSLIKGFEVC